MVKAKTTEDILEVLNHLVKGDEDSVAKAKEILNRYAPDFNLGNEWKHDIEGDLGREGFQSEEWSLNLGGYVLHVSVYQEDWGKGDISRETIMYLEDHAAQEVDQDLNEFDYPQVAIEEALRRTRKMLEAQQANVQKALDILDKIEETKNPKAA